MRKRGAGDFFLGPVGAPRVKVNPFDGSIDLEWADPFRTIVSLRDLDELRVLMGRLIEAVQSEHVDVPAHA